MLAVAALALAGTLAPFTLFAFGQSRVSAEVAGAFLNLEPLVGAIAGAVAFGDPVGLAQVAGGLAILAGIGLSSLPLIGRRRVSRRAATVTAPRWRRRGRRRRRERRRRSAGPARPPGVRSRHRRAGVSATAVLTRGGRTGRASQPREAAIQSLDRRRESMVWSSTR